MDLSKYQEKIIQKSNFPDDDYHYWLFALELGEYVGELNKLLKESMESIPEEPIADEVQKLLTKMIESIALLSSSLEINLADLFER